MNIRKLGIFGRNIDLEQLKRSFRRYGFVYSRNNYDVLMCFGGDGTYLLAEELYPEIPKVIVKKSRTCKKCSPLLLSTILSLLKDNKYILKRNIKLKATITYKNKDKKEFVCVNDFILRNKTINRSLRFTTYIDNKNDGSYIGDGIVISTPFGSSAYFQSITKKVFKKGISIAYNNIIEKVVHRTISTKSSIKIKINREVAEFSFDSSPKIYLLKEGDTILIKKSSKIARLIEFF